MVTPPAPARDRPAHLIVMVETARAVRRCIRSVLEWAIAMDMRNDNPCDRVPLCRCAVEILDTSVALAYGCGLVFPTRSGRPVGMSTLPKMLQHHIITAVAHGFRWAHSETGPRRRRTIRAIALRLRWLARSRTRSRLLAPGRICSSGNGG